MEKIFCKNFEKPRDKKTPSIKCGGKESNDLF